MLMDQCAIKIKKQCCDVDRYGHNVVFFQNVMICSAGLLGWVDYLPTQGYTL